MNEWQRVTWDDDEDVSGPEFLLNQGATWPVLVRFESVCGYVNRTVSNRYNLFGEETNYKSVMVAPVVWPGEVGNEQVAAEVVLRTVGVYHPHHTVKLKRDLPHGTKLYTHPQPAAVNQQLLEALQHIMKMQTFGYLVLGEEATTKARAAITAAQEQSK